MPESLRTSLYGVGPRAVLEELLVLAVLVVELQHLLVRLRRLDVQIGLDRSQADGEVLGAGLGASLAGVEDVDLLAVRGRLLEQGGQALALASADGLVLLLAERAEVAEAHLLHRRAERPGVGAEPLAGRGEGARLLGLVPQGDGLVEEVTVGEGPSPVSGDVLGEHRLEPVRSLRFRRLGGRRVGRERRDVRRDVGRCNGRRGAASAAGLRVVGTGLAGSKNAGRSNDDHEAGAKHAHILPDPP